MKLPLVVGFDGYKITKEIQSLWKEIKPIGVILFKNNIKNKQQLSQLLNQIKNFDQEMLLSIDHEGGAINRFSDDIPMIASAKSMGRNFDWKLIKTNIDILVDVLISFNFNINFAPVLDLETENSSPSIKNRCFFPDTHLINEYNRIFVEKHSTYGIYCVGKHFPGLYKVPEDPHYKCSHFNGNSIDFKLMLDCYQNILKQNHQGVMSSHVIYPLIDEKPATISKSIISELLKNKLGFQGLIFSDCLEMKAIAKLTTPEQLATQVLISGHHILISSGQTKKDYSFQKQLAKGIKNFLNKNEQEEEILNKKISIWQQQLLENNKNQSLTGKKAKVVNYKEIIELNKNFIEKKIFKNILPTNDCSFLNLGNKNDNQIITNELKKQFGHDNCYFIKELLDNSKKLEKLKLSINNKSLILLFNHNSTDLLENFDLQSIVTLASQSLLIYDSVYIENVLFTNEEWILWGKNSTMEVVLLESIKDKFRLKVT